jgi:hypothetical protein
MSVCVERFGILNRSVLLRIQNQPFCAECSDVINKVLLLKLQNCVECFGILNKVFLSKLQDMSVWNALAYLIEKYL